MQMRSSAAERLLKPLITLEDIMNKYQASMDASRAYLLKRVMTYNL